jgi:hypothetical protein
MSMSVLAEDTEPTWANMYDMILTLDRGGNRKKGGGTEINRQYKGLRLDRRRLLWNNANILVFPFDSTVHSVPLTWSQVTGS